MRFSAKQFAVLAAPAKQDWTRHTAQRLHAGWLSHYTALHVLPADLEPVFGAVVDWAAAHDITGERDVASLCCIVPVLGHRFWFDPRFAFAVAASVGQTSIPRHQAVRALADDCQTWMGGLWRGDTIAAFAARMAHQLNHNIEPTTQSLHGVLPNHWTLCDADFTAQLIGWLTTHLPPVSFAAQRFALVACALVHGTGWLHDPQYARIAQVIMTAPTPAHLIVGLQQIYGELG